MDTEEEYYDVAISGISGKFPASDDVDILKKNLMEKQQLVREDDCRWNKDKWKVPAATGKISVIKKFDDTFFGIYSGVAAMMDPLTRVSIERAYEAVIDAGISPKFLRGSNTAVYTASCVSDSEAIGCDEKLTSKFWLLAHVRALLANRISYVLNLQGPSWTIDSNWIGGIECLTRAVDDIRKGRVESALVGVTNVITFPDLSQHWVRLGKLSPDGSCQPFEETANGYGRSEAVVLLFLQRAEEAKRVYATISHSDAMFCGEEANTLLKPKQEALYHFLQQFYSTCNVLPRDIGYLEADGSADKYLDTIELNTIEKILCKDERDKPLLIGSIKSNLGHTEGASPLVAITKAVVSLDGEVIPPNMGFSTPNKDILPLKSHKMEIVTQPVAFPEGKFAAINIIGLCTSVGHVVLKQNPKCKKLESQTSSIPRLVLLSARHEAGLLDIIDKLESAPQNEEHFSLINEVFKENITGHFYRGFTILGSTEKKVHFTLETGSVQKRPVWFVFAGMGCQWPGMGADLMKLPIFAASIREIDTFLAPLGIDIVDVIANFDPTVLKNVIHSFVGIAAVQIGMVDVLSAAGIKPDRMFGHSLGENGCAYADGCFDKYQTIMAAYFRGQASSEVFVKKGLMAAVGLPYDKLPALPENIQVACHNSTDSTTISGSLEDVEEYIKFLQQKNIMVRVVNSNNVAYHSRQVKPLAPLVLENIRKVVPNPKKRSSKWISTSIPESEWNSPLAQTSSADYHVNNFLKTVFFAEAVAKIPEEAVVIEISPHGLFQGILKRSVPDTCFIVPLGKRETSNSLNFLLSSIGKLHVMGLPVDANAIYPPVEYPVSRGTPSLASLATWNHETEWELNTYHDEATVKPLSISLRERKWRFLNGYKINEKVTVPFGLFLTETLKAFTSNDPILVFENVNIPRHVEVSANETTVIYFQVQLGSGNFEVTRENEVIMNGMLGYTQENIKSCDKANYDDNEDHDWIVFTASEIDNMFKQYSMEFSSQLSNIHQIVFTEEGCEASIIWKDNLSYFINSIAHVKMFYELCLFEKGPLLPSEFLRLSIEVEKFNTMRPGTKVTIFYDRHADVFIGSGFELIGFKSVYEPLASTESNLSLQNLQFVSHENPKLETMENYLGVCGQIVGENFYLPIRTDIAQTSKVCVLMTNDVGQVIDLEVAALSIFSALYQELSENQIEFDRVNPEDIKKIFKSGNKHKKYFLICNNIELIAEELLAMANQVGDIFVSSFSKTTVNFSRTLVKILEQNFNGYHLTLWKKKIPFHGKILKAKPDTNNHWLDEMEDELYSVKQQSLVVIQWHSKFIVDILDMVNLINSIESGHSFRYLLMMDENKVENIPDTFYLEQLEKGLVMNVFNDGAWGSVRNLEIKYKTPLSNIESFLLKTQKVSNINVEFVSIHESLKDIEPKKEARYFEFSGVDNRGSRIMGVADSDRELKEVQTLFQWPIPKNWSLEDAVTVPLAYIKTYYALVINGRIQNGSSVLIHSGYTILGEACIAVALSLNCTIFTSADTLEQAKYIISRFSNSSRLSILNSELCHSDIEILKLTNGKGVDAVINATSEQQLQQSFRCIRRFGTIIYFCDYYIQKCEKIGMEVFLESVKMSGVSNLTALTFDDHSKQQEISDFITKSIKDDTIKPIKRCVIKSVDENFTKNISSVNNKICKTVMQNFSFNNHNKSFTCDPRKSYMIVGAKNEIWFRTIAWLLQHEAKKLIIVEPEPQENGINQNQKKFSTFIQNYNDVSLMHLSESNFINENDGFNMMQSVSNYTNLDVVFCISLDSNQARILDSALRKWVPSLRQFVCLQSDAAKICESRRHSSLPALNILWDRTISNTSILVQEIKQILKNLVRFNSSFLCITDVSNCASKYKNLMMNRVEQFLPNSLETESFLESFSEYPVFRNEVSKCAEFSTRTQLFPIFILPGLHSNKLKKLIRKLMYPVFCGYTPDYSSVEQTAQSLIEPMKQIQPNGPYNIIGESWSGAVAMELTTQLENEGHKVQLILLEGIPKDLETKLASIGSFGSHDFTEKIYELCLNDKKASNGNSSAFPMEIASKRERMFLELLQRRIRNTLQYNSKHTRVRNKVIAIKMKDTSILNTYITFEELYGQELDLRIMEEDNYEDLISNDETATIINDNVLFKW